MESGEKSKFSSSWVALVQSPRKESRIRVLRRWSLTIRHCIGAELQGPEDSVFCKLEVGLCAYPGKRVDTSENMPEHGRSGCKKPRQSEEHCVVDRCLIICSPVDICRTYAALPTTCTSMKANDIYYLHLQDNKPRRTLGVEASWRALCGTLYTE